MTTPVSSTRLWNCLKGHPNRDYISSGFEFGFRIGISSHPTIPFNNIKPFHKPAPNRNTVVTKLNAELAEGRILGPYSLQGRPLQEAVYSPVYAIPKSTPGKFRLIHDLSKPRGQSVNDNIPNNLKSVEYCRVRDVAEYLKGCDDAGGPMDYMVKVDLKDAYRCVPIHRCDWKYLGMQMEDKLFIDTCLPQGLATSCKIFQSISDSIRWIFMQNNPDCKMFSYLDDFIVLSSTEQRAHTALSYFLELLNYLGFPVSKEKTVGPSTMMEFLGLGIDSKSLSFYVPHNKREKYSQSIADFITAKYHRVHQIQKLVGKLNFLCLTFLPGRALLASLNSSLAGVLSSNGWAHRRINNNVKADLTIWSSFLAQSEGKRFSFLFPAYNSKTHTMISDASGRIGYGCVFGKQYFSGLWQSDWWKEQNIALLEFIPIYIGIHMWKNQISDSILSIITDNQALVAMINNFCSKEKQTNTLLKDLALLTMNNNTVLRASYIESRKNVLADRLSRSLDCSEYLGPEQYPVQIPLNLSLDCLKSKLTG